MMSEDELKKLYADADVEVPFYGGWGDVEEALQFDTIRMPNLLDVRRKRYDIPAWSFRVEAMFDIVNIWQIPDYEDNKIPGSSLYVTDKEVSRKLSQSPRGIVVSAGVRGREILRSHMMDIGHVVRIRRLAIWEMPIGFDAKLKEQSLLIVNVSDIAESEDTAMLRHRGFIKYERTANGIEMHNLITGRVTRPEAPELPVEF